MESEALSKMVITGKYENLKSGWCLKEAIGTCFPILFRGGGWS